MGTYPARSNAGAQPVGLGEVGHGDLEAVVIWFASHNYLVPLLAGAAIIGFGQLASGVYQEQAWAFIPRKRQDRQRPLPLSWELGSGLALAVVLALALLLVTFRLDQPDVPVQVREFTFGMAAAGLLVLFGPAGPSTPATVLWGAAAMLVAGAGVGIWKLVERRQPSLSPR